MSVLCDTEDADGGSASRPVQAHGWNAKGISHASASDTVAMEIAIATRRRYHRNTGFPRLIDLVNENNSIVS